MSKRALVNLSLILTALIISTGCTLSGELKTSGDDIVQRFDLRGDLTGLVQRARVGCHDPSSCSEPSAASIGLVGFRSGGTTAAILNRVNQCTGFLLENNTVVALASHCVTGIDHKNCSKSLAIHFPTNGSYPAETRVCREILTASVYNHYYTNDLGKTDALIRGDYAFFRIDPVNRPVLKMASEPANEGDQIQVTKINPILGLGYYAGEIDSITCRTTSNTLVYPDVQSRWSETGVGLDDHEPKSGLSGKCAVRPGNSGSPVLNSRGEVIGVATQFRHRNFLNSLVAGDRADVWAMVLAPHQREFVQIVLPNYVSENTGYANLLCAQIPFLNRRADARCEPFVPRTRRLEDKVERFRLERLAAIDESRLAEYTARVPRSLNHKWRPADAQGVFDLEAQCVRERETTSIAGTLNMPYAVRHRVTLRLDSHLRVTEMADALVPDYGLFNLRRVNSGTFRLSFGGHEPISARGTGASRSELAFQDLPSCAEAPAATSVGLQ